jgi:hypothetical protein
LGAGISGDSSMSAFGQVGLVVTETMNGRSFLRIQPVVQASLIMAVWQTANGYKGLSRLERRSALARLLHRVVRRFRQF